MNIIITGVSKGIGKAVAELLAKDDNKIIGISRNAGLLQNLSEEIKAGECPGEFISYPLDINDLIKNTSGFTGFVSRQFEHVDILINNAGYLINKPFEEFTSEEANEIFNVNFFAVAKMIESLLKNKMLVSGAHVVTIGSMGGFPGSSKFPGLSYYSASKAAISTLTECLAEEYKDENICFNCLALGAVQTEMLEKAFPGLKPKMTALEMARFIKDFAINGNKYFNGKVLPVSGLTI